MKSDWKRFILDFGGPAKASLEVWLRGAGTEVPELFTEDELRGRSPNDTPDSFLRMLGRSFRLHLPTLDLRCQATFTSAARASGQARILTGTIELNMEGLECSSAVRRSLWPNPNDEAVRLVFGHEALQLKAGLPGSVSAYLFLGEAEGQVWQMVDCGDVSPNTELRTQLEALEEALIGRPIGLKMGSAQSAKVYVQVHNGAHRKFYSPDVTVLFPGPGGTRSEWRPRTLTFENDIWELFDEDRVAGLLPQEGRSRIVPGLAGANTSGSVIEWGSDLRPILTQLPPVYPVSTSGGGIQGEGWLWTWARLGESFPGWLRLRLESSEKLPVAIDALIRNPRLSGPVSIDLEGDFSASLDVAGSDSSWNLRVEKRGNIRLDAREAQAQLEGPELPFFHDKLANATELPGDLLQGWRSYFDSGLPPRSARLFCRSDSDAVSLESVESIALTGAGVRLVTRFGSYLGWNLAEPAQPGFDEKLSGAGPAREIVRLGEVDYWIDFSGTLVRDGELIKSEARAITKVRAGGVDQLAVLIGEMLHIYSSLTPTSPVMLPLQIEGEPGLASPAEGLLVVLTTGQNKLSSQPVRYVADEWTVEDHEETSLTLAEPAWLKPAQATRSQDKDWIVAQLSPTKLVVWELGEKARELDFDGQPDAWTLEGDYLWVAARGKLSRLYLSADVEEDCLSFDHPATALAITGQLAVIGCSDGTARVYDLTDGEFRSVLSALLPGSGARTRFIALRGGREFVLLSDGEKLSAWRSSARAGIDLRAFGASNVKRGSREPGHGLAKVGVLSGVLKCDGEPAVAFIDRPTLHRSIPESGQILALAPWLEWSPWECTEFRVFHRNLVLEVDELKASWPPDQIPGRPSAEAARRAVRDRHALAGELNLDEWVKVQNWLPGTAVEAQVMLSNSAAGLLQLHFRSGQDSWKLDVTESASILALSGLELDATGEVRVVANGRHQALDSSVEPLLSATQFLDNLSILRALRQPRLNDQLRLENYLDRKDGRQRGLLSGIKKLCADLTLYCRQLRVLGGEPITVDDSAGFAGEYGFFGSEGWPRIEAVALVIAKLQAVDVGDENFHLRASLPNPFRALPESDDAARAILTSSPTFDLMITGGEPEALTTSAPGFVWSFPGRPEFSVVGLRGRVDRAARGPFRLSEMTVQIYAFGVITEHEVSELELIGQVNKLGQLEYTDGQGTRVSPSEVCFDREFVLGSIGERDLTLRPLQGGNKAVLMLGNRSLKRAAKSGFQYAFLFSDGQGFAVLWSEPGLGLAGVILDPPAEEDVTRTLHFDGVQHSLQGKRLAWQVSYLGLTETGRDWVTSEYWTAFLADEQGLVCVLYGDRTGEGFGGQAILAWTKQYGGPAPIHSNVALVELEECSRRVDLTLKPGQSWHVETRRTPPDEVAVKTELWYGDNLVGLADLDKEPEATAFVTYKDGKLVNLGKQWVPLDTCLDQSVMREPELEPTGTPYMAHRAGSASRRMRLASPNVQLWTPPPSAETSPQVDQSNYQLFRLLVRTEDTGLIAIGPPAFIQHPAWISSGKEVLVNGLTSIELTIPTAATVLRIETLDLPHLLESVMVSSNGAHLVAAERVMAERGYDLGIPASSRALRNFRRIVVKVSSSGPIRLRIVPPPQLTESLLVLHGAGASADLPLLSILNVTSAEGRAMERERVTSFLRSVGADGLVFRRSKIAGRADQFEVALTADTRELAGVSVGLAPTVKPGYQELDPLLVLPGAAKLRRFGASHYRLDPVTAAFVPDGRRLMLKLDGQSTPQDHDRGYGLQMLEATAFEKPRPMPGPASRGSGAGKRFLPQELEVTLGVSKPGAMMIHKVEAYQDHGGALGRALELAWREPQRLTFPSPSSVSWTRTDISSLTGSLQKLELAWLEVVSVDLGTLRHTPHPLPPSSSDRAFGLASWVQERLLDLDESQRFPLEFARLASQPQNLPIFLVTRLGQLRRPVDGWYPLVTLSERNELRLEMPLSEVFGDSVSEGAVLIHPMFSPAPERYQTASSIEAVYLLAGYRSRTLYLWSGAAPGALNLRRIAFQWPIHIVASNSERVLVVLARGTDAHSYQFVNSDGSLGDSSMVQMTPGPLDAALGKGNFLAFLTETSVETQFPHRSENHEFQHQPRLGIHLRREDTAFVWGTVGIAPVLRLLILSSRSTRRVEVEGGLFWAASASTSGFACLAREGKGNLTVHTVSGDQEPERLATLPEPLDEPTALFYDEADEGEPRSEGTLVVMGAQDGGLKVWSFHAQSSSFQVVEQWVLSGRVVRIDGSKSGWVAICEDGRAFEFSEGGRKLTELVNLRFRPEDWSGRDLQFEWALAPSLLLADTVDVLERVTGSCEAAGAVLEIGLQPDYKLQFKHILLTSGQFTLKSIDFSTADGWKPISGPYTMKEAGSRKIIPNPVTASSEWEPLGDFLRLRLTFEASVRLNGCWLETGAVYSRPKRVALLDPSEVGSKVALVLQDEEEESTLAFGGSALNAGQMSTEGTVSADDKVTFSIKAAGNEEVAVWKTRAEILEHKVWVAKYFSEGQTMAERKELK